LLASLQTFSVLFRFVNNCSMDSLSDTDDSVEMVLVPVVEVEH